MGKAALIVSWLLSGIASISLGQSASELPNMIDTVRPSVLKIEVSLRFGMGLDRIPSDLQPCFRGNPYCTVGTGFFVNDHADVVTAFHVVDGYRSPDGVSHPGIKQIQEELHSLGIESEIDIGIEFPNVETKLMTVSTNTVIISATLIATDPAHDLALIRAVENPFVSSFKLIGGTYQKVTKSQPVFAKISTIRARDSEPIFACGYPFGEEGLVTTSGTIASAWNTKVLIRAEAAGFNDKQDVYNVDLRINPGNSGGPIFRLSDSSVVGVAVETLGSLGIAVPAKFVAQFLTTHGVPWTPANAPQEGPQKH
jgi:S1-C subfamily serine protease